MGYPAIKYITPQEYLELEINSIEKHEYFNGEIVGMAGNTKNHNLIVANLIGEIHAFLKEKNCNVYPSDFRLATPSFDSFMYPDVTIVCGETELKDTAFDTLTNPVVIIEVMSQSTENNDRGYKFFYYRQIPSIKEYILVDSMRCHAEIIRFGKDLKWEMININGLNEFISINAIDMQLPMKNVYDRVIFEHR